MAGPPLAFVLLFVGLLWCVYQLARNEIGNE
jgi:hypothetical protein